MYRSLLLAVDASHYSEVCTRYALEYARQLNARIKILTVLDRKELAVVYPYYFPSVDFPPVFDEVFLNDQSAELTDQQRKRAENRILSIENECRQLNLDFSSDIQTGLVADVILDESQYCDLLFMGSRGAGAVSHSDWLGSNFERIIRKCQVPVLITPHIYRTLQRVLVCFDGSEFSVKALHAAADLVSSYPKGSASIRLLVVQDELETARRIANKALEYLQAYSITESVLLQNGNLVDRIVETVQTEEVDLVAMGAYGHTHIREWILGSTTDSILQRINRAVLLQH